MSAPTRRRFLQAATGLLAAHAVPLMAESQALTPRQPEGPFYPLEFPLDNDNDLTRVEGQPKPATGEITDLAGRIIDRNGRALSGMRIEIWQCDINGRYRHPGDRSERPADPGFQGFGHTVTDGEGRYRFRTIRPAPYPGRTPHIHVAVYPAGTAPFITQLYVAGESRNADDFLYQRIPEAQRPLVTTGFMPSPATPGILAAVWDIVLGVTPA
jgi:protocatechuate 3,4-dioxygenase beta subunit